MTKVQNIGFSRLIQTIVNNYIAKHFFIKWIIPEPYGVKGLQNGQKLQTLTEHD